ncbi:MAG: hypothetical protein ABIT58_04495 [Ferruginibacter sp.]
MTISEKINYKIALQKKCIAILEERIHSIRFAMQEAQAAANSEEKSSAGDKYETSRAMNHLEKDMQASRLLASLKDLENLMLVDCNTVCDKVQKGSFVRCDKASYFIAAGLGKALFKNKKVFLVSPDAPIAVTLSGKQAGHTCEFNNDQLTIKEVF